MKSCYTNCFMIFLFSKVSENPGMAGAGRDTYRNRLKNELL